MLEEEVSRPSASTTITHLLLNRASVRIVSGIVRQDAEPDLPAESYRDWLLEVRGRA